MRSLTYLFIFLAISFYSCQTPRYVNAPAAVNAPLVAKAGDNKLAMYYSSNSGNSNENTSNRFNKSRGYDIQGAYAITNHWAVQASYFYRNEQNGGTSTGSFDSSSIRYKRKTGDIGIGYYKLIGNHSNSFQFFAGGGTGKYEINDKGLIGSASYTRFHIADVNKFYLQPALILTERNLSLGIISRFSFVHYKKIQTDYTLYEESDFNLSGLQNKVLSFWEPAFEINVGISDFPALKLEMQIGGSASIDNNYYDVKTVNGSVGLVMDFSKLKKK